MNRNDMIAGVAMLAIGGTFAFTGFTIDQVPRVLGAVGLFVMAAGVALFFLKR